MYDLQLKLERLGGQEKQDILMEFSNFNYETRSNEPVADPQPDPERPPVLAGEAQREILFDAMENLVFFLVNIFFIMRIASASKSFWIHHCNEPTWKLQGTT
jgi:hypothetical protein